MPTPGVVRPAACAGNCPPESDCSHDEQAGARATAPEPAAIATSDAQIEAVASQPIDAGDPPAPMDAGARGFEIARGYNGARHMHGGAPARIGSVNLKVRSGSAPTELTTRGPSATIPGDGHWYHLTVGFRPQASVYQACDRFALEVVYMLDHNRGDRRSIELPLDAKRMEPLREP